MGVDDETNIDMYLNLQNIVDVKNVYGFIQEKEIRGRRAGYFSRTIMNL